MISAARVKTTLRSLVADDGLQVRQKEAHRARQTARPQTTKPPDGGLSLNYCVGMREILERAKGLEPSTPTLARSCSTTELHPHPRCRRSLADNGRAMPNAGRECNSANTAGTTR